VQISDGTGRHLPTTVDVRKLEWLPFCVVSKYLQCIVWFSHKVHVWQTDGLGLETDGQNYDSQYRTSIAARAVNKMVELTRDKHAPCSVPSAD